MIVTAITTMLRAELGPDVKLFVEDAPAVRDLVRKQLEMLGHEVVSAHDSGSALEAQEREAPFDVLLTDVILPGQRDGTELAEAAMERDPNLRVLLMSGYPADRVAEACNRGHRTFSVLPKPFLRDDLARGLARVLDE